MVIINDINDKRFSFNGVENLKNFTPIVIGQYIRILNTYDSKIELTSGPTLFSDFEIDGNIYGTVLLTQSALLEVIYSRSTLGNVADNLISTDPDNALVLGTDDLLFVPEVSGDVLTTNTNITSSSLSTQDVAGFVAYINGLVSSFTVASNEIRTYTVTDTGQKFEILLRGRSFGGSEPDIVTSDVLEIEHTNIWSPTNYANWRILKAEALGGNQSTIVFTNGLTFINDGTAVTKTSTYATGNFIDTIRRIGIVSSTSTAGSTCGRRVTSGIQCSTKSGFYFSADTMSEDALAVATARDFVGLGTNFASPYANAEPSTNVNCILLANDSTDTNMQIMHNDSSGTCTKINLGANFPANTISTDLYRLELFCFPSGTIIYYKVTRLNTGHVSEGVLTTNIPGLSIPLTLGFFRNNGTTALAVTKSFSQITIATSY